MQSWLAEYLAHKEYELLLLAVSKSQRASSTQGRASFLFLWAPFFLCDPWSWEELGWWWWGGKGCWNHNLNVCASESMSTWVYLFSLADLIFIMSVHPSYWLVRGKPPLNLLLTWKVWLHATNWMSTDTNAQSVPVKMLSTSFSHGAGLCVAYKAHGNCARGNL